MNGSTRCLSLLVLLSACTNGGEGPRPTSSYPVCDTQLNRYPSAEAAIAAGLAEAEFGATYCPEYKMHSSWDRNHDGINDCADTGDCDPEVDYMAPRPDQERGAAAPTTAGRAVEGVPLQIRIPWLNAGENDDLSACASGNQGACEAVNFPGILDQRAVDFADAQCVQGKEDYCALSRELEKMDGRH